MQDVYIVAAKRTPVGTFNGALATVPAPSLGATAIRAALLSAKIDPSQVDECIMGEVLTAGVGQAPARQAALGAGLPVGVPCMTINKVCGSGLKSIMLGRDSILTGQSSIVVAGGQENMSLAPHLLENARAGYRMGHVQMIDSMIKDGLWDPYNNWHMGTAAELCVKEYKTSRQEQDEFAIESYKRAHAAQKSGAFAAELAIVEIASKKETLKVDTDEEPAKARFDKMPELRPAFDKDGTITAANASKINDGGAATILASADKVKSLGLKPIARIKALEIAKLKADDIDLWEINEAFSVVTMAAMKDLKIPRDKVNVNGGAVAIGHPIGASGTRIMTTLLHALKARGKTHGLATLCIGGGEAVAVIVEGQ